MKNIIMIVILLILTITPSITTNANVKKVDSPSIYRVTEETSDSIGIVVANHNENIYRDLTFKDVKQKAKSLSNQVITVGTSYHVNINGTQKIYQAIYQNHQLVGYLWHGAIQINQKASFSHQVAINTVKNINTYRRDNGLSPIRFDFSLEDDAKNKLNIIEQYILPQNNTNISYWLYQDDADYQGTSLSWIMFSQFSKQSNTSFNNLITSNNISSIGIAAKKSPIYQGNANNLNNYYVVIEAN